MSRAATSVGEVAARGPACAGLARRGARVSALFGGSGRRRGRQTLGLVLYLSGDRLEFRLGLAAVVGRGGRRTAVLRRWAGRRARMAGGHSARRERRPSAGWRGSEQ